MGEGEKEFLFLFFSLTLNSYKKSCSTWSVFHTKIDANIFITLLDLRTCNLHQKILHSRITPNLFILFVTGQGDVQEARQSLLDGLDRSPELDRLVVRLSFSQCLYLLSIHRLESLRSADWSCDFRL